MRMGGIMSRILLFAGIALGLASAAAAEEGTGGSSRYGIVDMQAVILNVSEGKDEKGKLEKEIKAKEGDFKKRQEELEKLNKDLVQGGAMMNDEAKQKKQQELQEKLVSYRNDEMSFQADIKRREQAATQKIATKVATMVEKMAKEKGLEVVFEANSAGVLYVSNPTDLTEAVIKAYDSGGSATSDDKKKVSEPIAAKP